MKILRRIDSWLGRVETGLLIGIFLVMLLVAIYQVVARNVFSAGFPLGDEIVRMGVLWLTLVGAVVAARDNTHIKIDLLYRLLSPNFKAVTSRIASLITAAVAVGLVYYSIRFVHWEYLDMTAGVGAIPAWVFELVIPVSAALVAMRYLVHSITGATTTDQA